MLFGAQYEDDAPDRVDTAGPTPSPPPSRRKKSSRTRTGGNNNGKNAANARMKRGAGLGGNNQFSPSSGSITSSSGNSLVSLNPNNNYYGYQNHNGNTPVKAKRKTEFRETPPRMQQKFGGVNMGYVPVLDRQCMYPSVWKQLQFRKRVMKLASARNGKPICVTGVDEFLASWIVCELLARGYRVRGTVQNRNDDISGILRLPLAHKNFTVVETSLLTPEACDMAVQGCDFVIHTGTPSSCSVRDPLSEQQEPGVHSIGSRMHCIIPMMTNFIQACARARVTRVVLTSSIAAMADSVSSSTIVNDACWNTMSSLERNPHFLSLKLAEEAAWQLVDQLPRDRRIDLVTINPGTLYGPALAKGKLAPGNQIIYDLITGQYSALVDLNWSMVDVRDCALAHIAALENSEARGRYICVNRSVWMKEIVDMLARNGYSGRDLPWKVGLPNWVARLPAYAIQLGQVGASLYALDPNSARSSPYVSDKVADTLNIRFRSVEVTIVEAANDLLKWGLIKPWAEDHEAIECGCCKNAFTFYRRKHHCRECGVIICSECSLSRAVVEGKQGRARLCDKCVKNSIPALLEMLDNEHPDHKRKAVIALESLLENPLNHDYVTRQNGIVQLLQTLHHPDETIANHAAGALCALSMSIASTLQMVLEGGVLQMLEVDESSKTWAICLQALRNIWKQINRQDFRRMLHAVARVSADAQIGELRGNILLTFVHMMDASEVPTLLSEGLLSVLFHMLQSVDEFSRCAAAHAIKHLVPPGYDPDVTIEVPPYVVDDHEELFLNSSLSDLQFLVKGHIAPINAHKVVLFFRNSYFKNMVRFGSATSTTAMIEVDNCSYETFSILLRFLYTGKVDITPEIAEELLRAASFYCVIELQKRAEAFLSGEIRVENVVDLLSLADECNASDLKKNCVPFLMRHIHDVVRLPSYAEHRIRSSEEVLKALAGMLGPEWEASYAKMKHTLPGSKANNNQDQQQIVDLQKPQPVSEVRAAPPDVLNANGELSLSPRFLLAGVPPRSFNARQSSSLFAVDSPRLNPVEEDPMSMSMSSSFASGMDVSYTKTLGNEDVIFDRARGFSEDLSEGVC